MTPASCKAMLRRTLILVVATALLAPGAMSGAAFGAFPDDVAVDRLNDVPLARRQAKFDFVVRELAVLISGPPAHAVGSLGYLEFEFAFDNRVVFLHTDAPVGETESAWDSLIEDGDAARVGYLPTLRFRKGLPWSIEVGMDLAWLAGSRQAVLGGYARWAFLDGWSRVPDMAVQLGYRGYVGNDELDLGVFELDLSIGYTFEVVSRAGAVRPATQMSPFAGYSFLMTHAAPAFVDVEGVSRVSAWANQEEPLVGVDPTRFRHHRAFVGLEIGSGEVVFRAAGDFSFAKESPVTVGFQLGLGVGF
jgi:hypothetical protein